MPISNHICNSQKKNSQHIAICSMILSNSINNIPNTPKVHVRQNFTIGRLYDWTCIQWKITPTFSFTFASGILYIYFFIGTSFI